MANLVIQKHPNLLAPPRAPSNLRIRVAVLADEQFIDHCQRMFAGHLGFLYQGTIARKITRGEALVMVDAVGAWVGYVMGTSSYDKNDQVSRIDQIAVVPSLQRRQMGGALVAEWIRRLPWGVKLLCCWCAQDLKEGRFWEAEGFIPLAFRAGGQGLNRVHIFWQRRVNRGDVTTPFWYPKETANGAMNAARIILPIPIGVDWREIDLPRVLPKEQQGAALALQGPVTPQDLAAAARPKRQHLLPGVVAPKTAAQFAAEQRAKSKHLQPRAPTTAAIVGRRAAAPIMPPTVEPKGSGKPRAKNVPEHVAAAREIRDRWLEGLNAAGLVEGGKYDPTRDAAAAPTALGGLASAMLERLGQVERAALPPS